MAVKNQDFEIHQGNSKQLIFTVEDVITLEGSTVKWACSQYSSIIIKKETPLITINNNTFTVTLLPEDTTQLKCGEYYHEAKVIDIIGNEMTVATGKMLLLPSVIKE